MAIVNLKTGQPMTRGGFLKGILASGIAPSITLATIANAGSSNASVARGMMRMTGARNTAMFGERKPYAEDISWIESDGSSYIDSGVYATQFSSFEIVLSSTTSSRSVFGYRYSSTIENVEVTCPHESMTIQIDFGNYKNWRINAPCYGYPTKYTFSATDKNGTPNIWTGEDFLTRGSLLILKIGGDPIYTNIGGVKIYSVKMKNTVGGDMDFHPVLGYDGKAYLHDRISNNLFGNSGSGSILYG